MVHSRNKWLRKKSKRSQLLRNEYRGHEAMKLLPNLYHLALEYHVAHHTRDTIQLAVTYLLWLWFSNVDLDSRQPFLDERPDERPLNTCLNHLTHYRLYKHLSSSRETWSMRVHQFSQERDTRKQPKLFTMAICLLGAFFLPFLINLIPAY